MTISSGEKREGPTWEARAYRLAQEIEWIHALDRSRLSRVGGTRMSRRERASYEYDEHAAVELGNLIISRLSIPHPEGKSR